MAVSKEAPKEVFLSYGRDRQRVDGFVQKLKSDLEAVGISVWQDKDDISAGSDWHDQIGVGVHACRALLCVLTDKYLHSRNCRGELFYANDKKKLIFPVLYETIDWDKDENSKGVGYVVHSFNRVDFRPNVDYHLALQKLVEGMKAKGLGQDGMQVMDQDGMQGKTDSPQSAAGTSDDANDTILSKEVSDHPEYLAFFRRHVSRNSANKRRAVLEEVGLDAPTVDACFEDNQKGEEAVQAGLVKWSEGHYKPPTWKVLIKAMEDAEFHKKYINGLKKDLGLH